MTDYIRPTDLREAMRARQQHPDYTIIAGCTEIPLALGQQHLAVPYFDSLTILARAAILRAGVTPVAFSLLSQ